MHRPGPFGVLVFVAAAPGILASERLFVGPEPLPVHSPVSELAIEDLDRDGGPDVVGVHHAAGEVSVLLGAAGFFSSSRYQVGVGPIFVTTGDLDGDGAPDLVVVNSGSSTVSALLNQGDGRFAPAVHSPVGRGPRMGLLADLNGDAHFDLVTNDFVNDRQGELTIALGTGTGRFVEERRIYPGDNTHFAAAADLDGDDLVDLAAVNRPTRGVLAFFRGHGDGSFDPVALTELGPDPARFVFARDVDGDHAPELLAVTDGGALLLLRHQDSGSFSLETISRKDDTRFLVVADLDSDGALDLLTPFEDAVDDGVRVFRGLGDGSFEPPAEWTIANRPVVCLGVADFDGDGHRDLLTGSQEPDLLLTRAVRGGRLGCREKLQLTAQPRQVSAVDLDGNGRRELLALSARELLRVRGTPEGASEAIVLHEFPAASLQRLASGDFDGDGSKDVAITDLGKGRVHLVSLDPDGPVRGVFGLETVDLPAALAVGDFDRDGVDDLVVADLGRPIIEIFLAPWREPLPAADRLLVPVLAPAAPSALRALDLDGDGLVDLAVGSAAGLVLLFGDGHGGFPHRQEVDATGAVNAISAGDIDSDGRVDLVLSGGDEITVIEAAAQADGERASLRTSSPVQDLCVEDADRDGVSEILAVTESDLLVLRRGLSGELLIAERYPVGRYLVSVAVVDLDGMGGRECVVADSRAWSVSVLRGASTDSSDVRTFRRGDADSDGRVGPEDALRVLGSLFLGQAALECPDAADVDDDGRVNITDVVNTLLFLFLEGVAPAPPGPESCGQDPTADGLGACRADCR